MDKSKPIIKEVAPYISVFLGGMGTLYGGQKIFGYQNKKDDSPNEKFHYIDGLIQIPDEMYNINEKYQPNNSGLYNYGGTQYSHEYHLKWSQNNCWVLSNLYLYFRPELKSTYEKYASKSIKEIINDLDNIGAKIKYPFHNMIHVFANGHQDFLNDLKQNIQNSNFDNIFKYFDNYLAGMNEEKKEMWDRIPDKNKSDSLISFYNYQTLYRFHYAVSIKNRCRIYTKMLNNPNKVVNIYEMDDLCKEGDSIPNWWFVGKEIYTKIFKILGQKCKKIKFVIDFKYLSSTLEYTNPYSSNTNGSGDSLVFINYNLHNDESFDFMPESNDSVWDFGKWPFNSRETLKEELKEVQKEVQNFSPEIDKFLKHGIKDNDDGSKSYVTSLRIQKSNHSQIIRLKYDDNLKCTHLVDKQCYQDSDNIVSVPNECRDNLFEFIFKHMNDLNSGYGIVTVHFLNENELRNNLDYYKEKSLINIF